MTSTGPRGTLQRAEVRDLLEGLHRRARGDLLRLPRRLPDLALGLLQGRSTLIG